MNKMQGTCTSAAVSANREPETKVIYVRRLNSVSAMGFALQFRRILSMREERIDE